jgi:hypothetical protein
MSNRGCLRVYGHGNVEVEVLVAYLSDLKRAYDFVFLFEAAVDRLSSPSGLQIGPPFRWRLRGFDVEWPPTAEQAASIVPQSHQLVLANVTIQSLGFWDFLGALNPLEVLQQYLTDRHERRKDPEYKEGAEQRRLEFEKFALEATVINDRIRTLKSLGANEYDLGPLKNELLYKPLTRLNSYQDGNLIESAELRDFPAAKESD